MRIIGLGFLLASILSGQSSQNMRLPKSRVIRGLVVDQNGEPLSNAEIGHTGIRYAPGRDINPKTGVQGRFQVTTNAPSIVV